MLHQDYVKDLKHFRAKTKTWEASNKHGSVTATSVKNRFVSKLAHNDTQKAKLQRIQSNLF
jgi:hypothetical protein